MYDPLSNQRRPVIEVNVDEHPLTCLSVRQKGQWVAVMWILWYLTYFILADMLVSSLLITMYLTVYVTYNGKKMTIHD